MTFWPTDLCPKRIRAVERVSKSCLAEELFISIPAGAPHPDMKGRSKVASPIADRMLRSTYQNQRCGRLYLRVRPGLRRGFSPSDHARRIAGDERVGRH